MLLESFDNYEFTFKNFYLDPSDPLDHRGYSSLASTNENPQISIHNYSKAHPDSLKSVPQEIKAYQSTALG